MIAVLLCGALGLALLGLCALFIDEPDHEDDHEAAAHRGHLLHRRVE